MLIVPDSRARDCFGIMPPIVFILYAAVRNAWRDDTLAAADVCDRAGVGAVRGEF